MGELLLCSKELASVPYYIESISLNVYSLEEICYYIIHNIDLIEPSFMDIELINWIKSELKMTSLSERLRKLMKEDAGLSEFVSVLVSGCNYCSKAEINSIQEALADFENKSEIECRKIRADRFLEKKRYNVCIIEYLKLLEETEVTGLLEGNIYHNLGTAYAGLFLFADAAGCYEKAYERNQNPISLKQQQVALQMAEGMVPDTKNPLSISSLISEDALENWKDTYERNCR